MDEYSWNNRNTIWNFLCVQKHAAGILQACRFRNQFFVSRANNIEDECARRSGRAE